MKKISLFCAVVAAMLFTACSSSPDKLSEGTIEDLVEDLLEESGTDNEYCTLEVGTYELNNLAARARLAKLKAAGMINYEVKRYAWWNKTLSIRNIYKWYDYVGPRREKIGDTYYDFEEHFVVTVSLTEEGKKHMVDSIPVPPEKIDEDMKQPDFDFDIYPESKANLQEEWPYIPNPEAVAKEDAPKTETYDLAEALEEEGEEEVQERYVEEVDDDAPVRFSLDIETSEAYKKAIEQSNKEEKCFFCASLIVEKVRFIQIYDDPSTGWRSGSAEVIVKFTDVTPFGRIMNGKYDGIRLCAPVSLIYFYDKGWILQDKRIEVSTVSTLGLRTSTNGSVRGNDGSLD